MIAKWIVGSCIIMHGHAYLVEKVEKETYLLKQTVTVFEEQRQYREYWYIKYIDKISEKLWLSSGAKCKGN